MNWVFFLMGCRLKEPEAKAPSEADAIAAYSKRRVPPSVVEGQEKKWRDLEAVETKRPFRTAADSIGEEVRIVVKSTPPSVEG